MSLNFGMLEGHFPLFYVLFLIYFLDLIQSKYKISN